MLSVQEAIAAILSEIELRPPINAALDDALGLVLAADVISGIDSPPFAKSQMDGFAVRSDDTANPPQTLAVIEEVIAGHVPRKKVGAGQAARIMTGAPLPVGADAVVPIESCGFAEEADSVVIRSATTAGSFVIPRGQSMSRGDVILRTGTRLQAAQLGILAELGNAEAAVWPRPTVAVLATGDELVPVDQEPTDGQIRNSNETMLVAQCLQANTIPHPLGIARDDRLDLQAKIAQGLACDVLCLSGGVSAGKLDLVPSALRSAGVREVFHKVNVKPGKPIWFGKLDATHSADGRPRWIFGLPGNPVSSMVCFELFVRTALRSMMGISPAEPQTIVARLGVAHQTRGDRTTYCPARLWWTSEGAAVEPVDWHGSFDLRATASANAMIEFGAGNRTYGPGDPVQVIAW